MFSVNNTYNSGNNSYTLTAPSGYAEYRWVKDEGDIENPAHYTTGNTKVIIAGTSDREVWTCFMKQATWMSWDMCVPFVVPNQKDSEMSLNVPIGTTVSQAGTNSSFIVDAAGITWSSSIIYNQGSNWVTINQNSNGASGRYNLGYSVSANNTGNTRTAKIRVTGQGLVGSQIVKEFEIFQNNNGTSTPLTSLNPTNSSSEWQGYGTARFNGTSIEGNTINIGGTTYTQGIGTHANSRIVYILNSAYQTFTGVLGVQQNANCGDGVRFTIKADGQTIYGPINRNFNNAPTVFSVSVSGRNTLELLAEPISHIACDHANWANVFLQTAACSTPPPSPTNVSSSPSSISSGSSSLSASCAIGIPVWSTGQTGSPVVVSPSITTNYTVFCQSSGCPNSNSVGTTVTVTGSNPCNTISNNLTMGTWTVTGHPLVAKFFHNQYWLTQRIGTNPEKFLVRGSNMLTRGDVNLANSTYSSLTTCFGWNNSNFGGLAVPNTTQFPTPAGFTLGYESDGTPFYTANGSCGLTAPTNVSASPASITSGQSSTLSATCATGTRLWSTGATTATIVVSPSSTTTYTVRCTQAGCPDSPTTSVTVQVGPCSSLSHNLVMGTWNVTGHQLVAKFYHNQWWLVQRIATNPERFLVRGSEMLTRGDVTLTNGSYSGLVGCFAWAYSPFGGLGTPNSSQFPTPSGWQYGTEPDGTPFYTSTGGARLAADQDILNEVTPSFVSIYPNPNQGTFSVKIYLESAGSLDIDLINSSGKIYQSMKAEGVEGQNEIPFSTQNISSGNYLIRVKTKDKVESTVVVIR